MHWLNYSTSPENRTLLQNLLKTMALRFLHLDYGPFLEALARQILSLENPPVRLIVWCAPLVFGLLQTYMTLILSLPLTPPHPLNSLTTSPPLSSVVQVGNRLVTTSKVGLPLIRPRATFLPINVEQRSPRLCSSFPEELLLLPRRRVPYPL